MFRWTFFNIFLSLFCLKFCSRLCSLKQPHLGWRWIGQFSVFQCQCSSIQLMWRLKLKYKSEVFTLKRPTLECKIFLSYILTKDSLLDLHLPPTPRPPCLLFALCLIIPFVCFAPISFHNIAFLFLHIQVFITSAHRVLKCWFQYIFTQIPLQLCTKNHSPLN